MKVAGSLATQFAPPFSLVLHYFIGSFIFNLISMISLFWYSGGFEPPVFSFSYAFLAHTFLLGSVMMTIFGALYQLIPVALEVPVFSFRIAYLQFYIYLTGILLFIHSFWTGNTKVMLTGATLLFFSFLMFLFNFFMSIRGLEKSNITARFLIWANVSLFVGSFIGLFMVFSFVFGFPVQNMENVVYAHLIFTLFGFVFMVIMGVSMVLLPMFSLSHKFRDIYINLSFFVMVISVFGGGFTILFFGNTLVYYSIFLMIASAVGLYLLQVYEIYRKRARRVRDTGTDIMFSSHFFILLFILSTILTPLSEKFVFASAFLLIFGFINTLIYGSMYKILPFLTWFHRFSSLVGKKKVPMLNEMLPEKLPLYQILISSSGVFLLTVCVFISVKPVFYSAAAFMTVGSLVFMYINIYVLKFKLEE
ncbi:hypothetical protein GWK41_02905 [Persephonella atlantica]|uniref:Cytochrome C and Quinol oxidase polypeptide I n=1 Tax=Persephonella atlantica TaxID=2699429 RepID=A0ABS1GGK0_9AQUI|nr:hypothetical protein [Persephonella atlantica]MBK3332015.1 hypothetical protein [Persephonella atlantica]